MKIYKSSDRIPVKLGPVTFWLSPMLWKHKTEIIGLTQMSGGQEKVDGNKIAFLTVKYSLKSVDGLQCADGSPYELETDSDGIPSDDAVSELFQLDNADRLVLVASTWIHKIKPLDLEGVEIDLAQVKSTKKK